MGVSIKLLTRGRGWSSKRETARERKIERKREREMEKECSVAYKQQEALTNSIDSGLGKLMEKFVLNLIVSLDFGFGFA